MEDNKLINKEANWTSTKEWKIEKAPGKGKLKNIQNGEMVLGIPKNYEEDNLVEEAVDKNKNGQLWKEGIEDNDGYFTLKNKESSEFLAADSDNGFKVKGTIANFFRSFISFVTLKVS